MRNFLVSLACASCCMPALAENPFHPDGSTLSFGTGPGRHSVIAATTNPAAPSTYVELGINQYRFGLISAAGMTLEFGDVNHFIDTLDDLVDQLDDTLTSSEAIELADEFNAVLPKIGREGYINAGISAHLPGFPLVISHRALEGALLLDMYASSQFHGRALDRPVTVNPISNNIETNSAIYTKATMLQAFSAAYSKPVYHDRDGQLHAGVKAKFLRVGLNKTIIGINELVNEENSVRSYYQDEFTADLNYKSAFGLDAGLVWVARTYQLGLTLKNITSPA